MTGTNCVTIVLMIALYIRSTIELTLTVIRRGWVVSRLEIVGLSISQRLPCPHAVWNL